MDNKKYNDDFINEIKNNFNDDDELFAMSFYIYLNNDPNDFCINLENIYTLFGYKRYENSKYLINKYLIENKDYIIKKKIDEQIHKGKGGHNKIIIYMTINAFKELCMKVNTSKSNHIKNNYIKLENIYNKYKNKIIEDKNKQLYTKDKEYKEIKLQNQNKYLKNYNKKKVLYLINIHGENLVKFGKTNDIQRRFNTHKKEISDNITLEYVFESQYYDVLENLIKDYHKKEDHILYNRRTSKEFNNKIQTELIKIDNNFSIEKLYDVISNIQIKDEIILKLMNEIVELKNKNVELKDENIELIKKNSNLKDNIIQLKDNIIELKDNLINVKKL